MSLQNPSWSPLFYLKMASFRTRKVYRWNNTWWKCRTTTKPNWITSFVVLKRTWMCMFFAVESLDLWALLSSAAKVSTILSQDRSRPNSFWPAEILSNNSRYRLQDWVDQTVKFPICARAVCWVLPVLHSLTHKPRLPSLQIATTRCHHRLVWQWENSVKKRFRFRSQSTITVRTWARVSCPPMSKDRINSKFHHNQGQTKRKLTIWHLSLVNSIWPPSSHSKTKFEHKIGCS